MEWGGWRFELAMWLLKKFPVRKWPKPVVSLVWKWFDSYKPNR
jgi:hypothetical protein